MDEPAGIFARKSGYLDCYVQLGIAQGRVLSVTFPAQPEDAAAEHELLDRVERYLQGDRDEFDDVAVAMTMPTDQRELLQRVRELPYGENATAEQLALLAGRDATDEAELQAIREALAANPTPIFVPTHRVRDGPGGAPPAVEAKLRALEGL